MDLSQALFWTEKFIAFAVILQTLEFFQIRKSFSDQGVWNWKTIRRQWSTLPGHQILDFFLAEKPFLFLLNVRLISAVLTLFVGHWVLIFLLLITSYLITLRWRGAFNGGSDAMTILVLVTLFGASLFPHSPKIQSGFLFYLAAQTCLSYFLPGIAKLRSKEWRSGQSLQILVTSKHYGFQSPISKPEDHVKILKLVTWLVVGIECLFPLALVSPLATFAAIGLAFLFHLANAKVFGLNRFFFAWISAYPAVLYLSQQL